MEINKSLYKENPYNKENRLLLYLSIIAIVTSFFNSKFYNNFIIQNVFVLMQSILLILCLFRKKYCWYVALYLIFISLSFETSAYFSNREEVFYGFKNSRLFGISISLYFLVIPFIILFFNNIKNKFFRLFKKENIVLLLILFLTIVGFIMGVYNLLINDNNIINMQNYFSHFFDECYYAGFTLCFIWFIYLVINKDKSNFHVIKYSIFSIFIANAIVPILAFIFGSQGGYGGKLIFPLSKFLLPFIILIPFLNNKRHMILYLALFIIGCIFPILFFNAGTGKELVLLFIAIIIFACFVIYDITGNKVYYILVSISMFTVSFIVLMIVSNFDSPLGDKANQLFEMLMVFDNDWLKNLPTSPQVRIYELISIGHEVLENPISLICGKGYLGSFVDFFDYFHSFPVDRQIGMYSLEQFANNTFYRTHETLARILLNNGIVGILIMFFICYKILKKGINFWSVIAFVYFIFYYNTTITLSCIGIVALVINQMEVVNNEIG